MQVHISIILCRGRQCVRSPLHNYNTHVNRKGLEPRLHRYRLYDWVSLFPLTQLSYVPSYTCTLTQFSPVQLVCSDHLCSIYLHNHHHIWQYSHSTVYHHLCYHQKTSSDLCDAQQMCYHGKSGCIVFSMLQHCYIVLHMYFTCTYSLV